MNVEFWAKSIISLILLVLAFIPELVAYGVWALLEPTTFWEKAITVALLATFGLAISIFAKVLAFGAWVHLLDA